MISLATKLALVSSAVCLIFLACGKSSDNEGVAAGGSSGAGNAGQLSEAGQLGMGGTRIIFPDGPLLGVGGLPELPVVYCHSTSGDHAGAASVDPGNDAGAAGAASMNAGGASTGGASTGGASTGGASIGGASTGGASTGGASTGGASTGGAGVNAGNEAGAAGASEECPPPPSVCAGGPDLIYYAPGVCVAGKCQWTAATLECPDTCRRGACGTSTTEK